YLLFFAGATAARFDDDALRRFAKAAPESLIAAAYLCVTTAIAFKLVGDHLAICLYAVAGTLLTISACYGDGWLNRLFTQRTLRRIGNVSYSLFLTHTVPVFFIVYVFGPRWLSGSGLLPALAGALVAMLGALALAGVLFLVAERPYFSAHQRKHA